MNKAEKIYNALETIEEKGTIKYLYLFIYIFFICLVIIGNALIQIPVSTIEYHEWIILTIGLSLLIIGSVFLFMVVTAIENSLKGM